MSPEPITASWTERPIGQSISRALYTVWATVALGYPLSDNQQVLKKKENVVGWVED